LPNVATVEISPAAKASAGVEPAIPKDVPTWLPSPPTSRTVSDPQKMICVFAKLFTGHIRDRWNLERRILRTIAMIRLNFDFLASDTLAKLEFVDRCNVFALGH